MSYSQLKWGMRHVPARDRGEHSETAPVKFSSRSSTFCKACAAIIAVTCHLQEEQERAKKEWYGVVVLAVQTRTVRPCGRKKSGSRGLFQSTPELEDLSERDKHRDNSFLQTRPSILHSGIDASHQTRIRTRLCGSFEHGGKKKLNGLEPTVETNQRPIPLFIFLGGHPLKSTTGRRVRYHLCLLLLVRQAGYIVNLLDFYSYRLIGKLTAFLYLQEFSQRNPTVASSTSAARSSHITSKAKLTWLLSMHHPYVST
jgi:hypothetical protein